MTKKILTIILIGIMLTSIFALAEEDIDQNQQAEELKELGLFKGSDKGFELERPPKRIESAVMLVRLLGKETEVLEGEYNHPFNDVPAWADKYVGYMYEKGLTKGISEDKFGSDNLTDLKSYSTFVLRTLGYDDTAGDFSWASAAEKAQEVGILAPEKLQEMNKDSFLRGDMVEVSYNTLKVNLKEQEKKLINKLLEENIIKKANLEKTSLKDNLGLEIDFSDVIELELEDGIVFNQDEFYPESIKTYIIRDQLPKEVQNFTKIAFTGISTEKRSVEDIIQEYIDNKGVGHYEGDTYETSGYGSIIQNTQDEERLLILFDIEDNVLAYHYVQEGDYNFYKEYFVDLRVELKKPHNGNLWADSFNVIKKINGKVDTNFIWRGGGTLPKSNDDGLLTEVIIVDLLKEDDNVSYEVKPLKNFKIKRVIVE